MFFSHVSSVKGRTGVTKTQNRKKTAGSGQLTTCIGWVGGGALNIIHNDH